MKNRFFIWEFGCHFIVFCVVAKKILHFVQNDRMASFRMTGYEDVVGKKILRQSLRMTLFSRFQLF